MKTEVKNENELIAEFMGLNVSMFGPVLYLSDEDGMVDFKNDAQPYWPDRNWNQLMPVVEKIEKLGYDFDIQSSLGDQFAVIHTTTDIIVDTDKGAESVSVPKIEAVYKAVVEFIRWYNQQTTSNP